MFDKVLLTTDGSEFSETAVSYAESIGATHITVVEVIDSVGQVLTRTTGSEITQSLAQEFVDAERRAAGRHVDRIVGRLKAAGVANVAWTIREGHPGREIVALADSGEFDVVVMSTHGRSGLKRAILGSVADYVAHHIRGRAVLLVHPRAEEA